MLGNFIVLLAREVTRDTSLWVSHLVGPLRIIQYHYLVLRAQDCALILRMPDWRISATLIGGVHAEQVAV